MKELEGSSVLGQFPCANMQHHPEQVSPTGTNTWQAEQVVFGPCFAPEQDLDQRSALA